jgi:hypothetical protein
MNASRIDSRDPATSAGSPPRDDSTRWSGIGCTQVASDRGVPRASSWDGSHRRPELAGARSMGRARRLRPFSMSKQTLVAIRYNHGRNPARSSSLPSPRHARTKVFCTASSASWGDPSIR